jgi:hypothetical protein
MFIITPRGAGLGSGAGVCGVTADVTADIVSSESFPCPRRDGGVHVSGRGRGSCAIMVFASVAMQYAVPLRLVSMMRLNWEKSVLTAECVERLAIWRGLV